MAALLGHGAAARRLGGSVLQRAEAEGRRLGPRFMHTKEKEEAIVRDILQKKEAVMHEVQLKKEELYDLIAKAEQNPKTATWPNLRLLQHLSGEITPRPHDSVWDHVQSGRRFYGAFKKAGLVSLPFMLSSCWEYCGGYLDDKKVALATIVEGEHEA